MLRMQEIIKLLNDSRITKIISFCDYARKLEKHRSERFKIILKNAYQQMHENMYLMPYDIQKFFENKVQVNYIENTTFHTSIWLKSHCFKNKYHKSIIFDYEFFIFIIWIPLEVIPMKISLKNMVLMKCNIEVEISQFL